MPEWQAEIETLEHEATRAFLARDVARLDQLWSDHLLVNSPINRVHDKRTVLDLLAKGVIVHCALETAPELITRDGDLVIVMGSDRVQDLPDAPVFQRRFTNVWRQEAGAWRLYLRHANIVHAG